MHHNETDPMGSTRPAPHSRTPESIPSLSTPALRLPPRKHDFHPRTITTNPKAGSEARHSPESKHPVGFTLTHQPQTQTEIRSQSR